MRTRRRTQALAALALAAATLGSPAADLPGGLVLHLGFDKAEMDGLVRDTSGKGNHGRFVRGKWISAGKTGGGHQFWAGTRIDVPHTDTLQLKQGTLAVWFKSSRMDADWRQLLSKRAENGFALGLGGDAGDLRSRGKLAFTVNGCKPCLSDYVIADGSWHHAAATYDGAHLRLYVDGRPQKQVVALAGEIGANTDPLTVGMKSSDPDEVKKNISFEGVLDEVMVFNRALTAGEIKKMVDDVDPNAAKPRFTKKQIQARIRQLTLLYEEGLLTRDFYERKVEECNVPVE